MRVLIVEQDPDFCQLLKSILSEIRDCDVTVVPCDERSYFAIAQAHPDIIVVDLLIFRKKECLDFIVTLASFQPPIRIILISAVSDLPKIAEQYHVQYLSKPFNLDELFDILVIPETLR